MRVAALGLVTGGTGGKRVRPVGLERRGYFALINLIKEYYRIKVYRALSVRETEGTLLAKGIYGT